MFSRTLRPAALLPRLAPLSLRASFSASSARAAMKATLNKDSDDINKYVEQHSSPLPEKFAQLHASSLKHYPETASKTISALQGQWMQLLMRMTRPKRVLELGCFMGFSAMAMADGMPPGSTLYTCEKDAKAAQLARDVFLKHGYTQSSQDRVKIELLEGAAMSSLHNLADQKMQFDCIFIDADKAGYIAYYDFILDNNMLSDQGYIIADNALFSGLVVRSAAIASSASVASPLSPPASPPASPPLNPQSLPSEADTSEPDAYDPKLVAWAQKSANNIHAFNQHVKNDPRVSVAVLPVFDGLSVIMKK
ncbi:hypothetical protein EDD11_004472 [Mortierella claussenii]|nr:hypothetical protein EDD11_004472 [Mortierella claussenii]